MAVFHRNENTGRILWVVSIRYWIALLFPFFDGDAPGRAYTPYEREEFNKRSR